MKNTIVKAVVLCTLALSLLFVGVASFGDLDANATYAGIINHDGPYDEGVEY